MTTTTASRAGALNSNAAADYLGVAPKTLANWRNLGDGPRFVRLGKLHGRVVYRISDLDAFLDDHLVDG